MAAPLRTLVLTLGLGLWSVAGAQVAARPAFETVSIKEHPAGVDGRLGFSSAAGGRIFIGIATITALVSDALDVDRALVGGAPEWSKNAVYDVRATSPDDSASRQQALDTVSRPTSEQRAMILNMLVERFGLKYHFETREMPVYLLERGKGALKLTPPKHPERAADPRGGLMMRVGGVVSGEGFGQGITMDGLARNMDWLLDRQVVDRTGIDGNYDFHVDPIEPENRDALRGAILMCDALGLKLSAGRALLRVVVIDAATPPSPN